MPRTDPVKSDAYTDGIETNKQKNLKQEIFSWSLTSLSLGVLAQSTERACEQSVKWDIAEDVNTLMLTFFRFYF